MADFLTNSVGPTGPTGAALGVQTNSVGAATNAAGATAAVGATGATGAATAPAPAPAPAPAQSTPGATGFSMPAAGQATDSDLAQMTPAQKATYNQATQTKQLADIKAAGGLAKWQALQNAGTGSAQNAGVAANEAKAKQNQWAIDNGGGDNNGQNANLDKNGVPIQPGSGVTHPIGYQPDTNPTNDASQYITNQNFIPAVPANEPTAVKWDVTPEQTVQGQMDQLTKNIATNPVYQSLADQLERVNASKGGGNSLMAESAAYNQVVGLAYNIATADAATYAQSAEFNASMANQYGLAEQQFINTATLSNQNFQQSQVLQASQIKGNLDSVTKQINGQLAATTIAGNASVAAAGASAAGQVAAARVGAEASTANALLASQTSLTESQLSAKTSMDEAQLSSTTSLSEADTQRKTTLDGLQIGFQNNWMLNQQGQSNNLQTLGAQEQNQITNAQIQFTYQSSLQTNTENNANLRQLMASVGTVGSTPGLTPQQQANAIQQLTDMYKTNTGLTNSFYGASTPGMSNGSVGANINGIPAAAPGNGVYSTYGNYMLYPGFQMTPPPVAPYYGGTGTTNIGSGAQTGQGSTGGNFLPPVTNVPGP